MSLELTELEKTAIADLLRHRIGEIRQEIHHANLSLYKDELRASQTMLKTLLEKIEVVTASLEAESS